MGVAGFINIKNRRCKVKRKLSDNMSTLVEAGAVCVVMRHDESVSVMLHDRDNQSPSGAKIRTYLPGKVDGRWDGPLLTTAAEVLSHLGENEEPCSVPVALARSLFNWPLPFADLPERGTFAD